MKRRLVRAETPPDALVLVVLQDLKLMDGFIVCVNSFHPMTTEVMSGMLERVL